MLTQWKIEVWKETKGSNIFITKKKKKKTIAWQENSNKVSKKCRG